MPSYEARHAFNTFMHTLLARRLAAGRITDAMGERQAVEDLWRDPLVNQRWQRLALRLTADDCERIGRLAAERGLAGGGLRWLTAESATEGWALSSAGYVESVRGPAELQTTVPVRSPTEAGMPRLAARPRQVGIGSTSASL